MPPNVAHFFLWRQFFSPSRRLFKRSLYQPYVTFPGYLRKDI